MVWQEDGIGRSYPINPGKEKILGLSCYKSLNVIKDKVDLAVIVIPGKSVLNVVESLGKQGVGSAIVISAGVRETGHDGLMAERKITEIAKEWHERPLPEFKTFQVDRERVAKIFQQIWTEGHLKIGDTDARAVMGAYGIPIPASKLCKTAEEAAAFAEEIGYPMLMKIASPDILHKTDIGGVRLNIQNSADVRDSFDLLTFRARRRVPDAEIWGCQVQQQVRGGIEVIVGMNRDPQFGQLMMFGLGGIYVEALKDVAFRIAPFESMSHQIERGCRCLNFQFDLKTSHKLRVHLQEFLREG